MEQKPPLLLCGHQDRIQFCCNHPQTTPPAPATPNGTNVILHHTPSYIILVDASSWRVGDVWFSSTHHLRPFVWFVQWPLTITAALCSKANPTDHLSICNLELPGLVLHVLALTAYICCYNTTLRHCTAAIWCDSLAVSTGPTGSKPPHPTWHPSSSVPLPSTHGNKRQHCLTSDTSQDKTRSCRTSPCDHTLLTQNTSCLASLTHSHPYSMAPGRCTTTPPQLPQRSFLCFK